MPTYDYECDACGHEWELFQKITDDPERKCPECKKKKARRLFGTGAAIVFKGSGFYQTDYRSESYKKGEKNAAESKKPKSETADSSNSSDNSKSKSDSKASSDSSKTNSSDAKSGPPKKSGDKSKD